MNKILSEYRMYLFIGMISLFYGCTSQHSSPNVLFILVDDLGWKDLGCYGSEFYETPYIDQLAGNSMRFTQAYAAHPVCSPTRAAIMTGIHPSRLHITDWIPGDDPKDRPLLGPVDSTYLDLEKITMAEYFKNNGYATFFAGKWHLGSEGYFPEDQGFDINIGGHDKGSPPGGYYVPYKNPKLPDGPEGEYLTDRLTNETITFIQNNRDQPFLAFLSFYTVHTPIQANQNYIHNYQKKLEGMEENEVQSIADGHARTVINQVNAEYASMVHALDQNIGKLMFALEEMELLENTVIVFTSDNGGLTTIIDDYKWTAPTSVKPLRAGKGWCYEGGIRIPLLIRSPNGNIGVSDEPVVSYDLLPTLLEMTGITYQESIDGWSLRGVLEDNKTIDREAIMWHYPHYHTSGWTPGSAIRKGKWKLVSFYENQAVELYDLKSDVGETQNLASEFPDTTTYLLQLMGDMQKDTRSEVPKKNVHYLQFKGKEKI